MPDKPNILLIWGDDIGITNLSCYSDGLMGYRTPDIDRIAAEGMRFTDSYGEQSCTAEPFVPLRIPKPYNLRSIVVQVLETFQKFPPRQKPASFTIDHALEKMQYAAVGHR